MPYLSKGELFRCSGRSASMRQINYVKLTLLVDVQDFAVWSFKTTTCVRVGVKQGAWVEKPVVAHLDEDAGFHGLEECAQGLILLDLLINSQDALTECMLTELAGDLCVGGAAWHWATDWNSKCSQQG